MILDTHLHLVDPGRFTYPAADADPELRRPSLLDAYMAQARPLGITRMIHMEVCVTEVEIEAETAHVTALPEPALVGAVASCRPEAEDFPAFLERAAANPRILGFRRVLHTEPADLPGSARFRENVRRLGSRYTFDLCALASQLPEAAGLAAACPDVTFVLDHCGIPPVRDGITQAWRDGIDRLAALPNVVGKVSGVIAYRDPRRGTTEDLRPFVEHCIRAFGWTRVVWGSDWPICTRTSSLAGWVEATHALLHGCSEDEKDALLQRNAERIYLRQPPHH